MIKFSCPQCGKSISAADEHAGKKARCPQCQHIMQIPAADGFAPAAKPAPPPSPAPVRSAPAEAAREAVAPRSVPKPPAAPPAKKPPPPEEDIPEVEEAADEAETPDEMEDVEEVEERPRRRRRDEDEEGIAEQPRRRARAVEEEEEEPEEEVEERPRRRRKKRRARAGQWADCPNCGARGDATRISFTFWGGILGPAILSHVRCNECGTAYNGKTGKDNTVAIVIYCAVTLGIALLIGVVAVAASVMK
jgi:phage FluMu protein Com